MELFSTFLRGATSDIEVRNELYTTLMSVLSASDCVAEQVADAYQTRVDDASPTIMAAWYGAVPS